MKSIIGERCYLLTGGPAMTITAIEDSDNVWCKWTTRDDVQHERKFVLKTLSRRTRNWEHDTAFKVVEGS